MNDDDFRRQLEEDAARVHAGSPDDLSRAFDGLIAGRIPFVRSHAAFVALDAYLMIAVDIYGRKGTIFKLVRAPSSIVVSRGSQSVGCSHYLDQAAIGFKYIGIQTDASLTPLVENGFPSMVDMWKPLGSGLLFAVDRCEIQKKVSAIVTFLKAGG